MANHYLEFEKPIQDIDLKIIELEADSSSTDHSSEISMLESKKESSLIKIFSELSRWQRVQLARHPQRPFSLDYIQAICSDFVELHGDRYFGDDAAVVSGIGSIEGIKTVFTFQPVSLYGAPYGNLPGASFQNYEKDFLLYFYPFADQ